MNYQIPGWVRQMISSANMGGGCGGGCAGGGGCGGAAAAAAGGCGGAPTGGGGGGGCPGAPASLDAANAAFGAFNPGVCGGAPAGCPTSLGIPTGAPAGQDANAVVGQDFSALGGGPAAGFQYGGMCPTSGTFAQGAPGGAFVCPTGGTNTLTSADLGANPVGPNLACPTGGGTAGTCPLSSASANQGGFPGIVGSYMGAPCGTGNVGLGTQDIAGTTLGSPGQSAFGIGTCPYTGPPACPVNANQLVAQDFGALPGGGIAPGTGTGAGTGGGEQAMLGQPTGLGQPGLGGVCPTNPVGAPQTGGPTCPFAPTPANYGAPQGLSPAGCPVAGIGGLPPGYSNWSQVPESMGGPIGPVAPLGSPTDVQQTFGGGGFGPGSVIDVTNQAGIGPNQYGPGGCPLPFGTVCPGISQTAGTAGCPMAAAQPQGLPPVCPGGGVQPPPVCPGGGVQPPPGGGIAPGTGTGAGTGGGNRAMMGAYGFDIPGQQNYSLASQTPTAGSNLTSVVNALRSGAGAGVSPIGIGTSPGTAAAAGVR